MFTSLSSFTSPSLAATAAPDSVAIATDLAVHLNPNFSADHHAAQTNTLRILYTTTSLSEPGAPIHFTAMNNAFPRSYHPPRRTRTRSCLLLVLTAAVLGGAVGFWKGYDEEFYFNLGVAAHNTRWGVNRGIDYTNEAARHAGYSMLDRVERVGDEVTNRLGQVKEVGAGVKERVGGVVGDMERWRDARTLGGMEKALNLAMSETKGHRVEGTSGGSEVPDVFNEDDDEGDVEDGIVVIASIGDGEGVSEWPTDLPLEGAADAIWDEEKW